MTTETDTTYNGWTNYETWSLALWLGNDQGSYLYWQEVAEDAYRDAQANRSFTRRERAALGLADLLKDETEENAPDLGASFYADMLSAALSEINWYEIAEHYVDGLDTAAIDGGYDEEDDDDQDANQG